MTPEQSLEEANNRSGGSAARAVAVVLGVGIVLAVCVMTFHYALHAKTKWGDFDLVPAAAATAPPVR